MGAILSAKDFRVDASGSSCAVRATVATGLWRYQLAGMEPRGAETGPVMEA
jgi:hypothetical protein